MQINRIFQTAKGRADALPLTCSPCCSLLEAELLVELVNASAGVDQLLLAGIERMALGADFNENVLLGGAGLIDGTAGAADLGLLIIRMDSGFHSHIHLT